MFQGIRNMQLFLKHRRRRPVTLDMHFSLLFLLFCRLFALIFNWLECFPLPLLLLSSFTQVSFLETF